MTERDLEKKAEQALVALVLSTATLVTCFGTWRSDEKPAWIKPACMQRASVAYWRVDRAIGESRKLMRNAHL